MCPVGAFREGDMMLYIDPGVCIDCDACRPHCMRGAIFSDEDMPEIFHSYAALNAQNSVGGTPIGEQQEPIGFPNWECSTNRPQNNFNSEA
ncbi:MAG: ferredoxin family protein [Planctomycetaceae bacterium]|nr:ferredoxin family protein [Planctomycetaceae bacterium]